MGHKRLRAGDWFFMIWVGGAIALALSVLAGTGVVAMAMYVSATDESRYTDEDCIP